MNPNPPSPVTATVSEPKPQPTGEDWKQYPPEVAEAWSKIHHAYTLLGVDQIDFPECTRRVGAAIAQALRSERQKSETRVEVLVEEVKAWRKFWLTVKNPEEYDDDLHECVLIARTKTDSTRTLEP